MDAVCRSFCVYCCKYVVRVVSCRRETVILTSQHSHLKLTNVFVTVCAASSVAHGVSRRLIAAEDRVRCGTVERDLW